MNQEKLRQEINVRAPWTVKRPTPTPDKDYGRHCMELHFNIIGKKGAVSLIVYTDQQALEDTQLPGLRDISPLTTIVYHYKFRRDAGKYAIRHDHCETVRGKCYGVCGTRLDKTWSKFISGDEPTDLGAKIIFEMLEKEYYETFGN